MNAPASAISPLELLRSEIRDREHEGPLRGADYRSFHRRLRNLEKGSATRIAMVGNVTCELLEPFLTVAGAREGFLLSCRYGGFGQHFQDLQADLCQSFDPQILFLLLSLEMLRPDAMARMAALSSADRMTLRDDIAAEIEQWIAAAQAATTATLLIANFPLPPFPALGIADAADPYGETAFYHGLNCTLLKLAADHPRVQLFDLAGAVARVGSDQSLDRRMFHVAKNGWTERLMVEIGRCFTRHLIAVAGCARKCLVLDADNTLWGGVLGEDGPRGIRIDPGDPTGEAFLAFQRRVKGLKDRGILLALCSKNNPAEMDDLFRQRPDMPLKQADFAARSVGWEAKSRGLVAIAHELNIALDSLVFLDDNPAEVAQVRSALPMVETVLLPDDVASFEGLLDRLPWFEKANLTAEDARKSDQYAEAAARKAALAALPQGSGYLEELGVELEVREANRHDLPRLHQLFTKTNQFNVTTIRYSPGELEAMIDDADIMVEVALMRDRFGDLGMIAALVIRRTATFGWWLDSFVMSCRAMGRGAETALLHRLQSRLAGTGDSTTLMAEYRPTARNAPVARLFEDHGFFITGKRPDGTAEYMWQADDGPVGACSWITMRDEVMAA